MVKLVGAKAVKTWLADTRELAFLDVREHGQYGEGHPFHATSVPFSRFEPEIVRLVPNVNVRIVLLDAGDGVAQRAATAAEALGYRDINVLDGGADGCKAAGFTLFAGVNVPSKTFGELLEHQRHTPRITAEELQALRETDERFVIVDGRPFGEYQKMNIPGGICCPNGELALRIGEIVPDAATKIIVNCAGRTRSIIGAETLIALGLPNPVMALENGTQGWFLAGLELERGANRRHGAAAQVSSVLAERAGHVRHLAEARGVRFTDAAEVAGWLADATRTTFLLDVRTPEEFAAASAPGFQHAPGGQLVQATDQWVGVMRARIVLADSDGIRAPMMAQWLAQLGHDVAVLEGGITAGAGLPARAGEPAWEPAAPDRISAADLGRLPAEPRPVIVDVRASFDYRKAHVEHAHWSIRPRLPQLASAIAGRPVVVVADRTDSAALAAGEMIRAGAGSVQRLDGTPADWQSAGLPVVATPEHPADADCIDYLFFVHDRHDGNAEAARGYIAWEMGLVAQLDDAERGVFRLAQ